MLAQENPTNFPEFVPTVEALVTAWPVQPLPRQTLALLMRHYEETGQYAKAEDALFTLLDEMGADQELVAFGQAFYERILRRSDAALLAGNLPRKEAEQSRSESLNLLPTAQLK